MEKFKVIDLFPLAVVRKDLDRQITQNEFEFLNLDRPVLRNIGNASSEDTDILNHPEMSQIKNFCQSGLDAYLENIICPTTTVSPYITQSWLNWTAKGQDHHEHYHPNSFLSGVFYLNTLTEDTIVFRKPTEQSSLVVLANPENLNQYNALTWNLPVSPGVLYIFPSWLPHSVRTNNQEDVRISIAFNSFLQGEIGNKIARTYLNLR